MKPLDAWKTWVPYRHRRAVIDVRTALRSRTDRSRPLPDFLVIGAQRAGTSSLYKYLAAHPDVLASLRKETEYFSQRYRFGEDWYRAHFPSRRLRRVVRLRRGREPLTFEASPSYLFHPLAATRAALLVPGAKLVVLLRDPVERAFSQYQHVLRRGKEPLSFEEAIEREPDRVGADLALLGDDPLHKAADLHRFSYLGRGRYAEQLERWLAEFPRERLLVVDSTDLYRRPAETYATLVRFLGLPDWRPPDFINHSYPVEPSVHAVPISPETRRRLAEYYVPHNRRLYDLLGRDFGWG